MEKAITEEKYKYGKPAIIRYADDFVILHVDREELQIATGKVDFIPVRGWETKDQAGDGNYVRHNRFQSPYHAFQKQGGDRRL
jgi:hypothetical protein